MNVKEELQNNLESMILLTRRSLTTMMNSKKPNILISGSGIAGSVCAFWILKACPGASVTIVGESPSTFFLHGWT